MNRKFAFVLAALTAAFAVPSTASAAVTCNHVVNGTMSITVTAPDSVHLVRNGNAIEVRNGAPSAGGVLQGCGAPTVTNTAAISVTDGAGHDLLATVSLEGGAFAPGFNAVADNPIPDIEITVDGGTGTDRLDVVGSSGSDLLKFGKTAANIGANLNNDVNRDDITFANGEQLRVEGLGGSDTLDVGSPGNGFVNGPVDYASGGTSVLRLIGGANDDTLVAGPGGWNIDGGAGNDTATGGAGLDEILVDEGNDAANGGAGSSDFVSYQFANPGVRVDLGISGPQNTLTAGTDTLSGFENIVGSQAAGPGDTLIGDGAINMIFANEGADTLIGKGGDDTLEGGNGADTASYSSGSTGPVTASLATNTTSGGAGTDTLSDIQNLTGSPFSDTLTGDGNANAIDVYDGILDTVVCGAGTDTTITDELGVDALNANCEAANRDSAPKVSVGSPPADGALTNDATPAYPLSANEGASFQVAVDGGGFQGCAASCEPPSLSDGAHTLTFRAVDSDENQHPGLNPVTRSVTVDATAPAVQISGPAGTTVDTTPTFTYSASEAASFECQVDGAGFGPCSGPDASHTTGPLSPGPHSFDVRATDAAGNQGTATAAFQVGTADTDPPETMIKKPKVKGDDVKIKFSSDESRTTFRCKLDEKKSKPCTSPKKYKNLDDGKHKVTVVGTDPAGNTDPSPAKRKFEI